MTYFSQWSFQISQGFLYFGGILWFLEPRDLVLILLHKTNHTLRCSYRIIPFERDIKGSISKEKSICDDSRHCFGIHKNWRQVLVDFNILNSSLYKTRFKIHYLVSLPVPLCHTIDETLQWTSRTSQPNLLNPYLFRRATFDSFTQCTWLLSLFFEA